MDEFAFTSPSKAETLAGVAVGLISLATVIYGLKKRKKT